MTAGSSTTSMTMVVSSEEMMHFIMGSRQKYVLMRIREMITSRVDTPVTMGSRRAIMLSADSSSPPSQYRWFHFWSQKP